MAILGEIQVRNVFVPSDYPGHTNMEALQAGANLDLGVFEPDGTAVTSGSNFMVALKNEKGTITLGDVIDPAKVTYARSVRYAAPQPKSFTVSNITAEVNEHYTVEVIVDGYGSLSVEDELLLLGFYKAKTGDDAEDIVDGLVRTLSNNLSRQEPDNDRTFGYKLKNGTVENFRGNSCLDVLKITTDGTSEVFTLTITTGAATAGSITLTLDDVEWSIPVPVTTSAGTATAIANYIQNRIPGYTAASSAGVVTVTSQKGLAETNATFAAGSTGAVGAVAVTTAGVDGTDFAIRVQENPNFLEDYYITARRDRLQFNFKFNAYFNTVPTVTSIAGNGGSGTGYQVRNLEYYSQGNRQDTFRDLGYPHVFETNYISDLEGEYNFIELGYYDEGRDDPMKSDKQLTIAIESVSEANLIITAINLALTNSPLSITALV